MRRRASGVPILGGGRSEPVPPLPPPPLPPPLPTRFRAARRAVSWLATAGRVRGRSSLVVFVVTEAEAIGELRPSAGRAPRDGAGREGNDEASPAICGRAERVLLSGSGRLTVRVGVSGASDASSNGDGSTEGRR